MKNNKLFAVMAIAAVILVFGALKFFAPPAAQQKIANDVPALDPAILVKAHSPAIGPADAKVTIVEFLDPECEACRAMHVEVKKLLAEYKDRVRLVIRYMPFHQNSLYAASLLEELREAGKFEEALNTFFDRQPEWGSHHDPKPELLATYATEMGLTKKQTEKDYVVAKQKWKIETDEKDGTNLAVTKTPTFFVNGRMLLRLGPEPLKEAIEAGLK